MTSRGWHTIHPATAATSIATLALSFIVILLGSRFFASCCRSLQVAASVGWRHLPALQTLEALHQCADLPRLLLHFIEQHGVDEVVADRLWLAVGVVDNQVGVDLGHFFGDQAVLFEAGGVDLLLVVEADGTQLHELAA